MSMPFRARVAGALATLSLATLPLAAQPVPRPAPAPAPAPRPAVAPHVEAELREAQRALHDARWEMDVALELPLAALRWEGAQAMEEARATMEHGLRDLDGLQGELSMALAPLAADLPRLAEEARWAAADAMRAVDWDATVDAARDAARDARAWGAGAGFRTAAPAPWVQDDPADSLYRVARETLNRGDYGRAATLFQQLAARFPRSAYAADAGYWEAFARYRLRTEPELRTALRVLEARLASGARSSTSADAQALAARIRGELAGWSDAAGARRMATELRAAAQAGDGCDREDAAVRIEALNALAKIDSAAVLPSVRRVLANQAPCAASLRERAVFLLGRRTAPEAVDLLLQTARTDASPAVRGAAVGWLARNPSDRTLGAIEELARGGDERTQSAAIAALARSEHPRAPQLLRGIAERADAGVRARHEAIMAIGRDTSAAAAAYLRTLYGRLDTLRLREAVLSSVARQDGAQSAQWLAGIARDANEAPRLRRAALGLYARRADVSVAELGRVYDAATERELRQAVIGALMARREPEATDRLLAIARSDDDARLRRSAIAALSRKDDPRTARLLQEIIDRQP